MTASLHASRSADMPNRHAHKHHPNLQDKHTCLANFLSKRWHAPAKYWWMWPQTLVVLLQFLLVLPPLLFLFFQCSSSQKIVWGKHLKKMEDQHIEQSASGHNNRQSSKLFFDKMCLCHNFLCEKIVSHPWSCWWSVFLLWPDSHLLLMWPHLNLHTSSLFFWIRKSMK